MRDDNVLKTYEFVFLILLIVHFFILVLNEILPLSFYLELTYGFLLYGLLAMTIAWVILLKVNDVKNLEGIQIVVLFFVVPILMRLIFTIGILLGFVFGFSMLWLFGIYALFAGIILMFYYAIKNTGKYSKLNLNKIDVMFILSAIAIILILAVSYL